MGRAYTKNPRRACPARVTVLDLCVCLSYHVFCHRAQQCAQQDIPAASAGHEQSFKNGVFFKSAWLWRHLLTAAASGAVAATLSFYFRRLRLLKLLKRLTVG